MIVAITIMAIHKVLIPEITLCRYRAFIALYTLTTSLRLTVAINTTILTRYTHILTERVSALSLGIQEN